MDETASSELRIRPLDELDLEGIGAIDEKIGGRNRPEVWERRVGYYLRRDPDASLVAEADGRVVGFMFGEVRSGEFGLDEPTGWIEVLGVDPDFRGRAVGRRMAEAMLAYFRAQGAEQVRTFIDEDRDDIRRFFAALGFEPASLKPFVKTLAGAGGDTR
jgi:ribosomal protein S18 acetylase RimI-like enzyme